MSRSNAPICPALSARLEALALDAQRFLGMAALGDVGHDADQPMRPAVRLRAPPPGRGRPARAMAPSGRTIRYSAANESCRVGERVEALHQVAVVRDASPPGIRRRRRRPGRDRPAGRARTAPCPRSTRSGCRHADRSPTSPCGRPSAPTRSAPRSRAASRRRAGGPSVSRTVATRLHAVGPSTASTETTASIERSMPSSPHSANRSVAVEPSCQSARAADSTRLRSGSATCASARIGRRAKIRSRARHEREPGDADEVRRSPAPTRSQGRSPPRRASRAASCLLERRQPSPHVPGPRQRGSKGVARRHRHHPCGECSDRARADPPGATVLATQRPLVTGVFVGPAAGKRPTTIDVPAKPSPAGRFVVAQAFAPDHWRKTAVQPQGRADWIVAVIDGFADA